MWEPQLLATLRACTGITLPYHYLPIQLLHWDKSGLSFKLNTHFDIPSRLKKHWTTFPHTSSCCGAWQRGKTWGQMRNRLLTLTWKRGLKDPGKFRLCIREACWKFSDLFPLNLNFVLDLSIYAGYAEIPQPILRGRIPWNANPFDISDCWHGASCYFTHCNRWLNPICSTKICFYVLSCIVWPPAQEILQYILLLSSFCLSFVPLFFMFFLFPVVL
jgi:hypothetical protein